MRAFIERNRGRMWAYDPAMLGVDHKQAYRHLIEKVATVDTDEPSQYRTEVNFFDFPLSTSRSGKNDPSLVLYVGSKLRCPGFLQDGYGHNLCAPETRVASLIDGLVG